MTQGDPVLEIEGLNAEIGACARLIDVSSTLRAGEITAVVGESGSGKTTLIRALTGLLPPGARATARRHVLHAPDGATFDFAKDGEAAFARARGVRIGVVFQDAAASLDPLRTVHAQLVDLLRRVGRAGRDAAVRRAHDDLRAVGLLPEEAAARPHELSGGQSQRAALALATALDPCVLLLDEPTSALDPIIGRRILVLLRALVDTRRLAALLVTHDLGVAAEIADRVAVLAAGRLVEEGPVAEVFDAPQSDAGRRLFAAALDRAPRTPPS